MQHVVERGISHRSKRVLQPPTKQQFKEDGTCSATLRSERHSSIALTTTTIQRHHDISLVENWTHGTLIRNEQFSRGPTELGVPCANITNSTRMEWRQRIATQSER